MMYELPAIVAMSPASTALRYAAAVFLILVAVALVYALIRLGRTLQKAEIMLDDVNTEVVPLLKQATETLDNINEELVKVDAVMTTVVDVTDKVDTTTRAVESAISAPAKKAAAWGAGVTQAVSSLFGRGGDEDAAPSWESDPAAWRREPSDGPAAGATWSGAGAAGAPAGDTGSASPPASAATASEAAPAGTQTEAAPTSGADRSAEASAADEAPSTGGIQS